MYRPFLPLAALPLLLLSGCKPDAAVRSGANLQRDSASPARKSTPIDPATTGTLTGSVSLSGPAPQRIPIDMSQDPACSMTGGQNLSEQVVADHGHLSNVYVYVKTGPASAMNAAPSNPAATHATLDQKGCRYIPHVLAIEHGGSVTFLNSDPTMHNVHTMPTVAGNQVIDVSMGPSGQPQIRTFDSPETMMPVRCNNHPWMNAFLNVSPTPFFAVTGADGKFTITGLPAGDYTIAAVQEKLGEQTMQVSVQPHATVVSNFTYKAQK